MSRRRIALRVVLTKDNALVDVAQLVMQGRLLFDVLFVHADDEVVRRLFAFVVRRGAVTEDERAAGGRVRTAPPTARLVAVEFSEDLIARGHECAEEPELGDVGSEPRPESVVGA